jgi:hypothetical protein
MTTLQYTRSLPVEDGFDVVVAGGGPSGVAAAVAAARMGCKTALLEQAGYLGGLGTGGLVNVFMPCADGERGLMGGIGQEVVETLHRRGFLHPAVTPDFWLRERRSIAYNGEGMKLVLDEIVTGAGVDLRFFTNVLDVVADGPKVTTLIVQAKERMYALRARYFVDATGDATVTAAAGFATEFGDEKGEIQAGTLCSTLGNVDVERYRAYMQRARRPGDWQPIDEPLDRAIKDGVFTQPDRHLPGIFLWGEGYGILNAGHLFAMNFLDDKDLTRGMVFGRKIAQEYMTFYRKYIPGCENMVHVATAPMVGVRETRRIVGEYKLVVDDYQARRSFPDEIGRFNYGVDIHRSNVSLEAYKALVEELTKTYKLGVGESYGIPYRSLIPKGAANLLVAGRCIAADRQMQGSVRVMPGCYITGHAAGVAAALCAQACIAPQTLDPQLLRSTLRQQGAYIP